MTGFGSAEASSQGWAMRAECRSVNHRGLDVRVWAPREWSWIEPFVLEAVRAQFHRGRVEVRVDVERDAAGGDSAAHVDMQAFCAVAEELEAARAAAGLSGAVSVTDVLTFDSVRQCVSSTDPPEDTGPFEAAIHDALGALAAARSDEGQRLHQTMEELVDTVDSVVHGIEEHAPEVADEYRARLESRVQEALQRFGVDEIDERSVLHEVAVYADRSDVSEELQRSASHVVKLREILAADDSGPLGKQIDFYLQELFREANTTGSKSGSVAITDQVIVMKSAIEKMREQAANIE